MNIAQKEVNFLKFSKFDNFIFTIVSTLIITRVIFLYIAFGQNSSHGYMYFSIFYVLSFFLLLLIKNHTLTKNHYLSFVHWMICLMIIGDMLILYIGKFDQSIFIMVFALSILSMRLVESNYMWLFFILLNGLVIYLKNIPWIYYIALLFASQLLAILIDWQKKMYLSLAQQFYENSLREQAQSFMLKDVQDGLAIIHKNGEILASNLFAQSILHQSFMDKIMADMSDNLPKTLFFPEENVHIHLLPASIASYQHASTHFFQGVKNYVKMDKIEKSTQDFLQHSFLLQIERHYKYEQQAQKEKLSYMGQLVGSIAHEIRNPLAAIQNASELLQDIHHSNSYHDMQHDNAITDATLNKKLIGIIQQNSKRINNIINSILQVGKYDEANMPIIHLQKNVDKMVKDWLLAKNISNENTIDFYLSNQDYYVKIFPFHLEQIIGNILDNAWRFCSKGEHSMIVCVRQNPHYQNLIELWLMNDGEDVAIADQIRLFEPFFSKRAEGDHPSITPTSGIGLGLYIVRMLCMQNKCSIEYAPNKDLPLKSRYGFVLRAKNYPTKVG